MAETAHIAEMAERLSSDLFAEFFWNRSGPTNQNWACEQKEKHALKSHPSDVVFYYDEPYSSKRTYITTDLKSYAKNSITPQKIKDAILSLAKQVSCAEISQEWQSLYAHSGVIHDVCGLLFVYNHDGDYDKEFGPLLDSVKNEQLDLPLNSRLYVLGPDDIFWLDNVKFEIQRMRGVGGDGRLPDRQYCSYLFPQLARKANVRNDTARAATMEMLTSPWIILKYREPSRHEYDRYVVFCKRRANGAEDFMYLIDHLRHYQLLTKPHSVTVKTLARDADTSVLFGKAKDQYIDAVLGSNSEVELSSVIRSISFQPFSQVVSSFSSVNLGMKDE